MNNLWMLLPSWPISPMGIGQFWFSPHWLPGMLGELPVMFGTIAIVARASRLEGPSGGVAGMTARRRLAAIGWGLWGVSLVVQVVEMSPIEFPTGDFSLSASWAPQLWYSTLAALSKAALAAGSWCIVAALLPARPTPSNDEAPIEADTVEPVATTNDWIVDAPSIRAD